MGEKEGDDNASQQRKCAEEEDLGLTAKSRMSAHNLKHPWTSGAYDLSAMGVPGRENGCFAKPPAKTVRVTNAPRISEFTAYAGLRISMEYPKMAVLDRLAPSIRRHRQAFVLEKIHPLSH